MSNVVSKSLSMSLYKSEAIVTARILLSIVALLSCLSCTSYKRLDDERAKKAEAAKGDVVVAAVWDIPSEGTFFEEGIKMAAAEINARGGILGRKLRVEMYIDVLQPAREREVARTIAADPNVVAVIGHPLSGIAIPVSLTYQEAGLLFISAGATSPNLTSHGFSCVFRNIPSEIETGKVLAEFSETKGFKKIVVIDDESEYGITLANIFIEKASGAGIQILFRRSYFPWQTDFRSMLHDIKAQGGDAIFLGGMVPQAAEVIKQARQMGITIPFIGGDGLDQPTLWRIAGSAAEGTIVSTIFNPQDRDPDTRRFVENFQKHYGAVPDTWAALGYDAVNLLEEAYNLAGSTVPIVAASFLRFIENRKSVLGTYSFTGNGDIVGKKFFFKVVRDGKFEYLNHQVEGD